MAMPNGTHTHTHTHNRLNDMKFPEYEFAETVKAYDAVADLLLKSISPSHSPFTSTHEPTSHLSLWTYQPVNNGQTSPPLSRSP